MVFTDEDGHASHGRELDAEGAREGDGPVAVMGNGEPDCEEQAP